MKNETKTMHLFAGIGGGLLADLILGHRPVVAVEWDKYACQVLRERAADGWFPGLHVWEGDVRLFNPSEYTGIVDCIHAGFPCQDISVAGKQAGVSEGTRSGLYREVLRIAGVVRPKQLFLENVSAILGNGLGTVLGDMAALGYDCRYLCIRASDVGAPHHRDRWFLLARQPHVFSHTKHSGVGWWEQLKEGFKGADISNANLRDKLNVSREQCAYTEQHEPSKLCKFLPKSSSKGLERFNAKEFNPSDKKRSSNDAGPACSYMADTDSERGCSGEVEWQDAKNVGQPSECSEFGYWDVECLVGRVANGIPNRVHRLKGLGNAQVPLQAAAAYRLLGGL